MTHRIATILLLTTALIATSCIEERPKPPDPPEPEVSRLLREMVEEDQELRMNDTLDYGIVDAADREHREVVMDLLAQGGIDDPQDLHRAAFILQHSDPGSCRECYLLAHKLAMEAVRRGWDDARKLAAASLDRYLVFSKKPQKYGTQSNTDSTGHWYLFPIDSATTDSQRIEMNVLPLDSLIAEIEARNL